ncbi:hypothetical protein [Xanthobacter versatilis]|uniref:hypothetical protein n=1 Tax=Xanthobacter autotrophicus (strain ATCC BAA-1158 / Py2) TaxID=78245 RepID=UPI00372A5A1C
MATQYIEILNVRGPQGFMAALNEAAARESLSTSEFARRALSERIERVGVTPPASPKPRKRREA